MGWAFGGGGGLGVWVGGGCRRVGGACGDLGGGGGRWGMRQTPGVGNRTMGRDWTSVWLKGVGGGEGGLRFGTGGSWITNGDPENMTSPKFNFYVVNKSTAVSLSPI